MRNPNDLDLVERMRAGDETAVAELSADYRSRILQLAFRYMRNHEDAEEVAQDVLLKVYQNIDAFRGDAALSSWIYRITFNTAMSRLRSSRAERTERGEYREEPNRDAALPGSYGSRLPAEVADWSSLADDELLRAQLRRKLVRALRDLPPIYRLPVLLRDVHGLTTEEASAVLRVKDQTLKSRLHRGRLMLRDQLQEFSSGLAMHRGETPPPRLRRRSSGEFSTRH